MNDISNFTYFEIIIIGSIIIYQIKLFTVTKKKIIQLENLFPEKKDLEVDRFNFNSTIHNEDNFYQDTNYQTNQDEYEAIICLDSSKTNFFQILESINQYLKENRNSILQFDIIKDITNRKVDEAVETIESEVPTPLYVGLIGTIVGIIIGLISMAFDESFKNNDAIDFSINGFLIGVGIAMLASGVGVFLYVLNSIKGIIPAKHKVLGGRNTFFDFIQTRLLPIVNKDLSDVFNDLQINLTNFNKTFESNILQVAKAWKRNRDTIENQEKILKSLETIKLDEIASANIKIYQVLKGSISKLEQFNLYLENLNGLMAYSDNVATRLNSILNRTQSIEEIAFSVNSTIETGNSLLDYTNKNIRKITSVEQSVNDSQDIMNQYLLEFQNFVSDSIKSTKELVQKENENMAKAYNEIGLNTKNFDQLPEIVNSIKKQSEILNDIKLNSGKPIKTTVEIDNNALEVNVLGKNLQNFIFIVFCIIGFGVIYFVIRDIFNSLY